MDSALQLRPVGAQWMWEDHAAEMHCGNPKDLAGSHLRAGEAARVSGSRRAGEDGRVHAAGTHTSVHMCVFLYMSQCYKSFSLLN